MKKHLAKVILGSCLYALIVACDFGAFYEGCQDTWNCSTSGCSQGGYATVYYYCQKQGAECCQCEEVAYYCTGSGCGGYRYVRNQTETDSESCVGAFPNYYGYLCGAS